MKNQIDEKKKKVTSSSSNVVWESFPATIKFLQEQRNLIKIHKPENLTVLRQYHGLNATIILLSAVCIEGFLVECLLSYTMGTIFTPKLTFEERLDHDFLERVTNGTFRDLNKYFTITLGKSLGELVEDKQLWKGIVTLFALRNKIGHGRSIVYLSYSQEDDLAFEIEHQLKSVEEYLKEIEVPHSITTGPSIISKETSDHFVGLIKPFMEAVVKLLPTPQSDNVIALVKSAWR